MKLIRQPKDNNSLCGQACVAMVAGVSLEKSVKTFGSRGCTTTGQVVIALRKLGVKAPLVRAKRVTKARPAPQFCIAKMRFKGRRMGHWVVIWKGKIYDPDSRPGTGLLTSFVGVNA